jgi:UPF0755 protein
VGRYSTESRRSKPKSGFRSIGLLVAVVILLSGATVAALNLDYIKEQYLRLNSLDYEGPGTGEVVVKVAQGDDGEVITNKLLEAGVIKEFDSFYRLVLEENPTFYPGSFILKLQMSNASALKVLTDQSKVITYKVTIPEGYRATLIFDELAKVSGIPKRDFVKAAEDLSFFGIPAESPTIEGYLFPATYSFDPSMTAKEILKTMVERMFSELEAQGVSAEDTHRILTLASIIQREARFEEDFYNVSRVFANRVKKSMRLETDPTISYSYDGTDMSESSVEEARAFGYNTYVIDGLPRGPISSPGAMAIDATLNPAEGKWLFFCTINLETGETIFSNTLAEHEVQVAKLRQWEMDNPGWYDQ